ncbi:MAG: sigma 54-interacting transcriptional regulator [Myxococcota bacterium]
MHEADDPFADATTIATTAMVVGRLSYPFVLTVTEGQDTGRRHSVQAEDPTRVLVGKSEACGLRLSDPSVSRRHVALEVKAARLRLTDLSSTNGTRVDGIRVGEAFLEGGETIRIGATAIAVSRGRPVRGVALTEANEFGTTLGASTAMKRLYPLCERLAATNLPVVIEGETGTGKERLAESIHQTSSRASGPFVVFDCTSVAPTLIESELFGHERGAFTGSVGRHRGVFEQAQGGSLLIDEIGDLPLELQSRLLRVIERYEVRRVGGDRAIPVDVRLLAATRRDLDKMVQLGRFRDDLFHRLAVARIELPPLRDRHGDVGLLARTFWSELGGDPSRIPSALTREWEEHSWPGNVRELRNAVMRRLALGDLASPPQPAPDPRRPVMPGVSREPTAPMRDPIAAVLAADLPLGEARQRVVDELERRYVHHVLDAHGGNVTRAAAAAGVARRYFHRLKVKVARRQQPPPSRDP